MKIKAFIPLLLLGAWSCRSEKNFDATGAFEAVETIISAEVGGTIRQLDIEEGQILTAGQPIGYIDSTQIYLKKKQLQTQIRALLSRKPNAALQLAALEEQLATARYERLRVENLVKADAATRKQLDDVDAQISVILAQIDAAKSSLEISTDGLDRDAVPLFVQIEQTEDMLRKCRLHSPVSGTVLTKYAQAHELANTGKQLFKIADLSTIILRVYITASQLSEVKIGQDVSVLTDNAQASMDTAQGTVTWISDKAEFTPKTVQTKDERANLVYAMKVKVVNDGRYKIGMYGEIVFHPLAKD